MAEFDLSAERAKRSRESKTLVMRDDDGATISKYELVAEFPADALDLAVGGRLGAGLRLLFEDKDDAEEFMEKHKPSIDDFLAIMRQAYGLDHPGESLASGS